MTPWTDAFEFFDLPSQDGAYQPGGTAPPGQPVMTAAGWWTLPAFVPGADPVGALAREFAGAARRVGLSWDLARVRDGLEGKGLAVLAEELLLGAPEGWNRRRLLVVVDQLEELLTAAAAPGGNADGDPAAGGPGRHRRRGRAGGPGWSPTPAPGRRFRCWHRTPHAGFC